MTDWFSAFARERDPDVAKNRVTGATRVTQSQKPNESAICSAEFHPSQLGNVSVTRATSSDFRDIVTRVTPLLPSDWSGQVKPNSAENGHSQLQVTPVTQVTSEIGLDAGVLDDWQDCYQERAAIMEYDGELSREEAERQALEWCINTWLEANPTCGFREEFCPVCDEPISRIGDGGMFYARKEPLVLVHRSCVDEWPIKRRNLAIATLAKMGIYCNVMEATK
jgi:hypothetical protein